MILTFLSRSATFASLGGVLYGYNQGVFAQVQVMYDFETRFASVVSVEGLETDLHEWLLTRECVPVFSSARK